MSFTNTRMRDVFTRKEIKDWNVRSFQVNKTRWHKGQRLEGLVKIHATWKYNPAPGITAFKYHRTEIVRIEGDKLTIDNNGWVTPTTKKHINEIIPYGSVSSSGGDRSGGGTMYFGYMGASEPVCARLEINPEQWIKDHLPYGKFVKLYNRHLFKMELDGYIYDCGDISELPKTATEFKLKAAYNVK